jgi:hypothetical protein
MTSLNPQVCAWLAGRHGIASGDALRRLGVTSRQLDYLVRQGVFERLRRDVFRLTAVAPTDLQHAAAACSAHSAVVFAFTSAGRLWDLRQMGPDRRVHVLVPGHSNPRVPGAVLHRCDRIDPVDVVRRSDGIRVTSPPRTVFDLASVLTDDALPGLHKRRDRRLWSQGIHVTRVTDDNVCHRLSEVIDDLTVVLLRSREG